MNKCRACGKTVYVMDQQVKVKVNFASDGDGDGVVHKSCFRCRHCNASLQVSNFCSSVDGALYCKPHFNQHQIHTNNTTYANTNTNTKDDNDSSSATKSTSFQSPAKSANNIPPPQLTRSPSKAATMFSGTQDKCATCAKTAYPLEKVTVEGQAYHKSCFKCSHGGCTISPSNYAALEGVLYCKHHFSQLFKEKGSYNHIMKSASIKRTTALSTPPESQPITSSDPHASC
ncbi:GATA type zinc finger transcription factor family protein [Rhynchospora pubera]|uniref:GATA type zinc finger transcription factor family protein n=1 Tax=Rhynchospora pubera TaxID=906938 RepID=A0AAV8HD95_9POAL|nr:GATA type zinc finger transcription factor family protein [Rhynchospora pubera]